MDWHLFYFHYQNRTAVGVFKFNLSLCDFLVLPFDWEGTTLQNALI